MKAVLGDIVIAEAPKSELLHIEGNWYFPPSSVNEGILVKSPTQYTCPWKGEAQYFGVKDGDTVLQDRAWSYPTPFQSAHDRIGADMSGFVAFWKEVKVTE